MATLLKRLLLAIEFKSYFRIFENHMLQIDLLRHGKTELSHTLRGSTDDALTPEGWQQMQRNVDAIFGKANSVGCDFQFAFATLL